MSPGIGSSMEKRSIESPVETRSSSIIVLDGGFATQLSCHVNQPIDGDVLWSARFLGTDPQAVIDTHLDFLRGKKKTSLNENLLISIVLIRVGILIPHTYITGDISSVIVSQVNGQFGVSSNSTSVKDLVGSVLTLYLLLAGADVIMTNTYQASINGFVQHLKISEKEAYDLIMQSVHYARTACDRFTQEYPELVCLIFISISQNIPFIDQPKPLVVGSVGPYGASLHDASEYTGSYAATTPVETMREWHRPRIAALVEAGVDLLALETIPCRVEAEMLLDLIKEFPNIKAWLAFSCKSLAIVIKKILFRWIDRDKCEPVDTYIPTWLDLGITWIGGCCRTYATDVTRIKNQVKLWQSKR
ncbi:hypothetical protein MML48_3g00001190 [Holotrichia oblita]|uniref:Uncharacterized protein n=1 Tax=Holotrichia oblita TaxID=644536 RepID=A0ACB9TDC2_HOLOL|nr:hypothetical protein MML48_3g00001190 [Holotrichia oblita]